MSVHLQIVGCSHHRSKLAVREQLAFSENQIQPFLDSFYELFPDSEAVLLSTCNRTELYTASADVERRPEDRMLIDLLARHRGLQPHDIEPGLFTHHDRDAVAHLFSVAASLDSMVVGETQILAQVKQAYKMAVERNPSIPLSHRAFQTAIRVARRVSNETALHSTRVSVPSVAIGVLAKQIFERLDNKKILILGAGEMAEETLRYVQDEGGKDIVVVSRTRERAELLAQKFDGNVAPWADLQRELVAADLIVSTTSATEPVVTTELFEVVEKARQQKPLFILDLAVPRDFAPEIGDRLNVFLYTLDDLQRECERNMESRKKHLAKARKILEQETDLFFEEMDHRAGGSTIAQLKQQADAIKQLELDRLMNKLELDPKQRQEIEYSFNRLVNKILHPPLKSLREDTGETHHGLLDALKRLFQLE